MLPLYRLLTVLGSAVLVPALWIRAAGNSSARHGLRERMGHLPHGGDPEAGAGPLWLQAVSVGEVRVAETFLRAARRRLRKPGIALSSTTEAGLRRARDLRAEETGPLADTTFAFPLDLPWVTRRALDTLRPAAFGSVETEIWPGLLTACGRRGIPTLLVNGSLSVRSARRWTWMSGAVRDGLRTLSAACMQTQEDAGRLAALGAPEDSIRVTGNMKFDAAGRDLHGAAARLRESLDLPHGPRVFVAGSTSPGEERIVLQAWREIRSEHPDSILILAPRHRERFDEVAAEIRSSGHALLRRSRASGEGSPRPGGVILLDTIGELEAAYHLAEIAFVGGSLVPRGGQNPLEPARAGVPILFGPGMDNFREVADGLRETGGARQVSDAASLARAVLEALSDPESRERAAGALRDFVSSHSGATLRTLEFLALRIPGVFS